MLADITGRVIETVDSPQNVGSVGACAVTAVGLGLIPDLDCVKNFIPVSASYTPDREKHAAYKKYYKTFKKIYAANKPLFKSLAEGNSDDQRVIIQVPEKFLSRRSK
jgi:xylulokinase